MDYKIAKETHAGGRTTSLEVLFKEQFKDVVFV